MVPILSNLETVREGTYNNRVCGVRKNTYREFRRLDVIRPSINKTTSPVTTCFKRDQWFKWSVTKKKKKKRIPNPNCVWVMTLKLTEESESDPSSPTL